MPETLRATYRGKETTWHKLDNGHWECGCCGHIAAWGDLQPTDDTYPGMRMLVSAATLALAVLVTVAVVLAARRCWWPW